MLDLQPDQLRELTAILQSMAPGCTVWAFGSRVNGHARRTSDLDLLVARPSGDKLPILQLADLADALTESRLPMLVDVVDAARCEAAFAAQARANGVLVQAAAT